ncbi:TRAF3-interacting protein 1 [Lamellibrachia satsuma]|nr:TRAF3-interacting protein 1 [Lamellibrachia satsuma]
MGEKANGKLDPKIMKKTQDTLGKIIKKPPLTEKLLSKPPFRFLHDIITTTIRQTSFMKGLFSESEMVSDNVKDKDSKVAFLQKAIDYVVFVSGTQIGVKPTKIVAGHDPDKTNEFLQTLAAAINKKVNNEEYVKKFLKGDDAKVPSGSKKERDQSSDRKKRGKDGDERKSLDDRKSSDKEVRRHRSDKGKEERSAEKGREHSRDRGRNQNGDRENEKEERRSSTRDKREHRKDRRDSERRNREDEKEKDGDRRKRRQKGDEKERESHSTKDAGGDEPVTMMNQEEESAEELPAARIPRPSSAKGSRRRHGHEDELQRQQQIQREKEQSMSGDAGGYTIQGDEDLPPQVVASRRLPRPSSARPAPPKPKKNEPLPEDANLIGSSNVPNLIIDKDHESDEEDDGFISKEDDHDQHPPDLHEMSTKVDEEDGEHGGLVKKMLEKKKELEGGSQQVGGKLGRKTEIERPQLNDVARRKERELVQREIDKLRGSIQTLTRSVNPLGKIMDFVQEDLDSMQKELEMWKRENKQNATELLREQNITDSAIAPLKGQLTGLDQAIADQLDLIAAVKSNILRNDERVEKMLSSITKS